MKKAAEKQTSNVFVQLLNKDDLSSKWKASVRNGTAGESSYTDQGIIWLTDYSKKYYATNARVVKIDANRILVMWNYVRSDGVFLGSYCVILSPNGKILQKTTSLGHMYIDGKPVYRKGYVYWTGGKEYFRDEKDYFQQYGKKNVHIV